MGINLIVVLFVVLFSTGKRKYKMEKATHFGGKKNYMKARP